MANKNNQHQIQGYSKGQGQSLRQGQGKGKGQGQGQGQGQGKGKGQGKGQGAQGKNAKSSLGSSNIFQAVLKDANAVQNDLLGPTYPYYKNINSPSTLGMSSNGSLSALGKDVDGLIGYVELLVEGTGDASKTGQPLGNKFFLKTGAKCLDSKNKEQDRYIYINNVPSGNIPFISQGMGENFTEFRGLIPGMMTDLNTLNPYSIMQAFLAGSTPKCEKIKMEVINNNNHSSNESHYVTVVDIQNMDPCNFPDGKNPITKKSCQQSMTNMNPQEIEDIENNDFSNVIPNDLITQLYFLGLSIVGIYILYKVMNKSYK